MNVRLVYPCCLVAAVAALGTHFGLHNAIAAAPGPVGAMSASRLYGAKASGRNRVVSA